MKTLPQTGKNANLCRSLMSYRGLKTVKATKTIEPLLPAIVMDMQREEFNSMIAALDLKHKLKKFRNDWVDAYHLYCKDFYFAFDNEQADQISDLMDSLHDKTAHDIEIVRYAAYRCMSDVDFDEQKVLASALICNILTQAAQFVHKKIYRTPHFQALGNHYLDAILFNSREFGKYYYTGDKKIRPAEYQQMDDACTVLSRRIINWLFKDEINTDEL